MRQMLAERDSEIDQLRTQLQEVDALRRHIAELDAIVAHKDRPYAIARELARRLRPSG
jgi:hypothetical protein